MAPWCSGQTCHPVTVEIRGSNPLGVADSTFLLILGIHPVFVSLLLKIRHKLPSSVWRELAERHRAKSLRQLSKEYNVSHESVRRVILLMGIVKGQILWHLWLNPDYSSSIIN